MQISIVIPTYGRGRVLLQTIECLLPQISGEDELLVVDQTRVHEESIRAPLASWSADRLIRWIRLDFPSVTGAMNCGLRAARAPLVLFLDDDIVPADDLVRQHASAHAGETAQLVAGRVIQPWEWGKDPDPSSPFNSPRPGKRLEFMGGNFSICRETALSLGGFDENFRYSAYRYEREFSDRLLAGGGSIHYAPGAWIRHLKTPEGGVRSFGNHLTTAGPGHSQGAYYYILGTPGNRGCRLVTRFGRSIWTRYHLRKPWHIPRTLLAESRGLLEAVSCWRQGRKLMPVPGGPQGVGTSAPE